MPVFSTPAILLRRLDFGDFDLIVTLLSLDKGKISLIAKSAKKSTKRFAGILELFSVLEVVGSIGRGRGLAVLQEAVLKHPFSSIRADIKKTAYASYWAELIHDWMEENRKQTQLYYLFQNVLSKLDSGSTPEAALSILFQMRLLKISGHSPNLGHCGRCHTELEKITQDQIVFEIAKGGILCEKCTSGPAGRINLSKGTIKQLLWVQSGDLSKAARIRFTAKALKEGSEFLEIFVPYYLGVQPQSLKFLRQIRQ